MPATSASSACVTLRLLGLSVAVSPCSSAYIASRRHCFAAVSVGNVFFFQAEDGIRDPLVTGVQTCALPIYLGMAYGPRFQQVLRVVRRGGLAIGEVRGQDTPVAEHLPPTVLDAALQTVLALTDTADAYLPVQVACFQLLKKPMGTALRCVLRLTPVQPEQPTDAGHAADLVLLEGDQVVCVLGGLGYQRVGSRQRQLYHEPRWVRRSARPSPPDPSPPDPSPPDPASPA